MKKKLVAYFIFIFMCSAKLCMAHNINIVKKKEFDIIASVDSFSITKYDLNNLIKIYYNNNDIKITNKLYNEILDNYIDILKKRIIAENNKINSTDKENDLAWSILLKNLNIKNNINIDDFCKNKKIDKDILIFLYNSNYLWLKYIETVIKPKININDTYIEDTLEYMDLNSKILEYNLSEIVLHFNDLEQKNIVSKKINDIYKELNNKNFDTIAFTMSKAITSKNNGLVGWVYEKELSSDFVNNIKNVSKNSFTKPFCIGSNKGSCFIFKVNDKRTSFGQNEEIKNNVKMYIFSQKLETSIRNILNTNKDKIKITYR